MKCDFCDGKCNQVRASAFVDDGTVCYLDTETNDLVMYYESAKHRFVRVKIACCPMCGRTLDFIGIKPHRKKRLEGVTK